MWKAVVENHDLPERPSDVFDTDVFDPDVFDPDVVDPIDGVNPDVFDPDDSNADGSNLDVSDLARSNPNALNPNRRSSRRRLQARASALGPSSSNSPKCSRPVDRLMDRYYGPPKNSVETAVKFWKGMNDSWKGATEAWRRSVEAEMTNGGLRELKDSKGSLCERAEQFAPLYMLREKYSEEDMGVGWAVVL